MVRIHETYHRLPTGLDPVEETRLATRAVARLQAVGYSLESDPGFATERREPHYPTLGDQVAHLATRIREAENTAEVAEALTELTAAHDGILAALGEVLDAVADFYQGLLQPAELYTANERYSVAKDSLAFLRSDVQTIRTHLADQQAAHPDRSPCPQEVAVDEREKSVSCPCPVPTRIPTPPAAAAPANRRR